MVANQRESAILLLHVLYSSKCFEPSNLSGHPNEELPSPIAKTKFRSIFVSHRVRIFHLHRI